ncbi:MAG: tRNA-specific 2-thiouridylase, partial [Synergistota bacterium]|nr:tRNA-specific 2-thiouridylase [Synergistota bacterium]
MKAVAGFSGGIDSAACCMSLLKRGCAVTAVYLRLSPFSEESEIDRVTGLAARIGVKIVIKDARKWFENLVLAPFRDAYAALKTPNPCVECNAAVKFPLLMEEAGRLEAGFVATGHYARIVEEEGEMFLARGMDKVKDQSYMLYRLPEAVYPRLVFPLGNRLKKDVVEETEAIYPEFFTGVPESRDLCFVENGGAPEYLREKGMEWPEGPISTEDGEILGKHRGLGRYTIGQRKGLGLSGGPWFVVSKDRKTNTLFVGGPDDLAATCVTCRKPVWRLMRTDLMHLTGQHRYRAGAVPVTLENPTREGFSVKTGYGHCFRGAAPGQSMVLYSRDRVIGGGIIESSERRGLGH